MYNQYTYNFFKWLFRQYQEIYSVTFYYTVIKYNVSYNLNDTHEHWKKNVIR